MARHTSQTRWGKVVKWLAIGVVVVLALAILLLDVFHVGSVALPPVDDVKVIHLEQGWELGWKPGEREWFHHADQGTKILHYDWFKALDQPELSVLTRPGKFSDPAYLQRFGFLPSHPDPRLNPDGLPLGFAVNQEFQEPSENAPAAYPVVGLTCAACHTGQVNFAGQGIRIEGGSAMVDLTKFQTALGTAMFYTKLLPWRFTRFARAVLDDDYNAKSKSQLRKEVDTFIAAGRASKAYADSKGLYKRVGGFSRTDALGLILNRVFDEVNQQNLSVADAPVNFPHIWDSSWFAWVQYNASIRTPMARNMGEVLGVGGMINLPGQGGERWKSTVNVPNLYELEKQLSGDAPYGGLTSPQWPTDVLGELDPKLVEQGKQLYVEKSCHTCHWRVEDIQAAFEQDNGQGGPNMAQMWTAKNQYGKRFINTAQTVFNLERIGTDSGAAVNFARRVAVTVNGREMSMAGGRLDYVTSRVREREYAALNLDEEQQLEFDAYRQPYEEFLKQPIQLREPENENDEVTNLKYSEELKQRADAIARLAYKARPLNGIWATPPYLHNGSVRNLYQLLSPVAKRDERFYLGSKEFDPVNVGYVDKKVTGGFEMDTTLDGNRNTGHEFRDKTKAEQDRPWIKGVLGPALTHDEKMAIIEYLKSL